MIKSFIVTTMDRDLYIDLAFWAVFLLGCLLRFLPGVSSEFPINDGGMLLAMIRDLRSNGCILPAFTSYNYADIPFAYPPLGMYVAVILSSLLTISDLELLRWLPPLVSAAIIPVFYWLALELFDSKPKACITAAFYAVMPGSYEWLIMGGGLTRSFGILFSLLALGYAYRMFRGHGGKDTIALATIFCALSVLSHPEVGLQTAGICFVFWAFYGRNISGIKNATLVASGTAMLTAAWWLLILNYHGFSPFQSALQTGIHETLLASLFHAFFSTQGRLPLLPVLILIGMSALIRKREFLLITWTFFPFLIDPRNAPAIAIFPFLMLASEGVQYLKTEFERAFSATFPAVKHTGHYLAFVNWVLMGMILLYFFFVSYASTSNLVALSLSAADRETMHWVKENTPAKSRFVLVTNQGEISPMADSFQEWFPALAERQSLNTLQGMEWFLGSDFFEYSQELVVVQSCPHVKCLNDWLEQKSVDMDFVLVQKAGATPALRNSLHRDEHYDLVYASATTEIFAFAR